MQNTFLICLQTTSLFLTFLLFEALLNFIFLYSHLAPSQGNFVGSKKLLEYSGETPRELCAFSAPFHLRCLRLHAELSHDLSLLSGSQKENGVEISFGDICEELKKMHAFQTAGSAQPGKCTHTNIHPSSISVQS